MTNEKTERRRVLLAEARRIVVKVGSGVLTGEKYEDLDENVVSRIADHVARLTNSGRKVAVVSSGSVSLGAKALGLPRRGLPIPVQQAAAAVGQGRLISLWAKCFGPHGLKVGQVLLTHDDMANRRRFLNSRNTINSLFDFDVIPIINENDTVAVHEIKFGDNDTLSARVTNLMEADLLAILSDVDGLYSADPRLDKSAKKIEYVEEVDEGIFAVAGDSSSRTGLGGMASKVRAAKEASRFGASTIILPGASEEGLKDVIEGRDIGTFFFPHDDPMSSKKHWIEFTLKTYGAIVVDDGAKKALLEKGKSLLASGVVAVEGDFESGEAVEVKGPDGAVFGKGLMNYHSHEMEKIKGCRSSEIENVLGYKFYDEVMHRDDMVLLK
ncbi:MAG: glutamate 5-kinase [Nitrospinota bacterium]|nr:glutamate 5-kinase [Nitrospinota bacterium]MDH5678248.1 glutamate 5-kinase [Nitrospinota bacterium]MDH5757211.1 glutamate 5-kinase [Nitrospinota bacterium]